MNANPEKAVDAITNPAPLTLAQIAIFEKINAPILYADISSLRDNLIAVWIYKTPIREVAKNIERREELALVMSENMSGDEYGYALAELVQAMTAFYEMMPRSEASGEADEDDADEGEGVAEGQEKKTSVGSAMDGSPSLRSGPAECMAIPRPTFSSKLKRFASHFSIGAIRRAWAG